MLPVGFEPTISAGERPKTYALDCAAAGTGCKDRRERNKQVTIEHNFIQYSYSYIFRPHGVIVMLAFRIHSEKYTYCIVDVRSRFS